MNFLVETKTEYTIQLINIVTPFLYEGFKSIYDESKKVSKSGEELKVFQTFLRRIPSWTDEVVKAETKRILTDSNCSEILEDLLRAVIKSNIMILTNTPPDKKNKLKINFIVELDKFIHNSYIESAKNIFQNPFLFFHKCTPLELKRNEREANETIKTSIMDAIRKMLPINIILKEYLGESFTDSQQAVQIDKLVSVQDKVRLEHLLKNNNFNENDSQYRLVKRNEEADGVRIENQGGGTIERSSSNSSSNSNSESGSKSSEYVSDSRQVVKKGGSPKGSPKGSPLNTIEKEKDKMPIHFKPKKESNVEASESYMPQKDMMVFEKYKANDRKNTQKFEVVRDTNTLRQKKGGYTENDKETTVERSEINTVATEQPKKKNNTNNAKKIYIDRDFKFNF